MRKRNRKDCAVNLHKELVTFASGAYRQVSIPIEFKGIKFDECFRADIVIEDKVILELKSVEHTTNTHKKQVLTYLRLTGVKLGYLLNFGEELMKNGISRVVI